MTRSLSQFKDIRARAVDQQNIRTDIWFKLIEYAGMYIKNGNINKKQLLSRYKKELNTSGIIHAKKLHVSYRLLEDLVNGPFTLSVARFANTLNNKGLLSHADFKLDGH